MSGFGPPILKSSIRSWNWPCMSPQTVTGHFLTKLQHRGVCGKTPNNNLYVPLAEHLTRPVVLRGPTEVLRQPVRSYVGEYVPPNCPTYPITQSLHVVLRQLLAIHQAFYPSIKCWYRCRLCCWREPVWLWQFAYVHIHLRIHTRFNLKRSKIG